MKNTSSAALQKKRQKARSALRRRDYASARMMLEQLCAQSANDTQSWLLLAEVLGHQGRHGEAIECCRRILGLEPNNVEAHTALGRALSLQGNHPEAFNCLQRALRLSPGNPYVSIELGKVLLLTGKVNEAVEAVHLAASLLPDNAVAQCLLGEALEAQGEISRANSHYQRAITLDPQFLAPHIRLGQLLLDKIDDTAQAEKSFRSALLVHPEAVALHYGLAIALMFLGRYDEALASVANGLRILPGDTKGLLHEVTIYERKGEPDEAYTRIRQLIATGQARKNEIAISLLLRLCRRYDCCDEAIAMAQGFMERSGQESKATRPLHQSLATLYDQLGAYDEAFAHFVKGNAIANLAFDREHHGQEISRIIEAFSVAALKKMPRASNRSERPVFIVGMPRSGTSLVEQILASHPEVYGAGELVAMNTMVQSMPQGFYPKYVRNIRQETLDELAQHYLNGLVGLPCGCARRVTDKLPGNFLHLGLIALLFPGARVIHCVRHPLDTCLSIFFQFFGASHTYATNLVDLGFYYREYQRVMRHWQQVLEIPMLEVRYEELIADQERVSRTMVEFCGLPWDDHCLQFYKTRRYVATASYDQVNKPIYSSSVARWKKYEKHLGPLKQALGWRDDDAERMT